jgi:hypothetical protein
MYDVSIIIVVIVALIGAAAAFLMRPPEVFAEAAADCQANFGEPEPIAR